MTPISRNEAENPPRSRATRTKSRRVAKLSNVPGIGRTKLASRIQQAATEEAPVTNFPNRFALMRVWKWIGRYLKDWRRPLWPFQTYPPGKTGVFDFTPASASDALTMAVAADWGTGTREADDVAKNIKAGSPQCTLHLGDVYYMGEAEEIHENCLGQATNNYTGVTWPRGSLGSFALMGNHEMYSGGQGYFQTFLPNLGMFNSSGKVTDPQSASYFCLNTPHWLVLGLDTGYHSGGMPLFTKLPLVKDIPSLHVNARFDDKLVAWLNQLPETLRQSGIADKPVLLLTHHQPISSFEFAFEKPVKQLEEWGFLKGKEFVWLYGHEHRLTIYKEQNLTDHLKVHPRCIGHGGMPVDVTKFIHPKPEILFYDPRVHKIDVDHPKVRVGHNGHVVLRFEGNALKIEYREVGENKLLLTETFAPDGSGGLAHSFDKPPDSPLRAGE